MRYLFHEEFEKEKKSLSNMISVNKIVKNNKTEASKLKCRVELT